MANKILSFDFIAKIFREKIVLQGKSVSEKRYPSISLLSLGIIIAKNQ